MRENRLLIMGLLLLSGLFSVGQTSPTAGCAAPSSSTFLEINNVRALIHNGGDMWWDLIGNPKYEVPKNSGKHSLFAGSIWIGGMDGSGNLHLAAQRYRMNGTDFYPGPLNSLGETDVSTCAQYDRHYITYRNEVEIFNNWFNSDPITQSTEYPDYEIPLSILEWPAHGDVALGNDYYLAPFFDANDDGNYDPNDGDYPFYDINEEVPCGFSPEYRLPRLFGDQNLWWVFNDNGNPHTETEGEAMKIEVRAQAFAFSTNNDVNNATFYSNIIINKSTNTYENTYIGVWSDADLGYAYDDYVGCNLQRGLGYLFNGLEVDEGVIYAYGETPPAVGIDFYEGPYMDEDGIDNPMGCNNSITGMNFGDGIADNERLGLSSFIYFNNTGSSNPGTSDPSTAQEHYYYLQGLWRDGTSILYGGTGHYSDTTIATPIPTNFMFPGTSDPCGWATGGTIMPEWSEISCENTPYDRRFIQSTGPFTLEPGEVTDLSYSVVWARAFYGDNLASTGLLFHASDVAQAYFDNCFRLIEGPDAPELEIISTDDAFVFMVFNLPASNNYLEMYNKHDYTIITPPVYLPVWDSLFIFQGYQVFQVINENVEVSDLNDESKARLVFQCDVDDDVTNLINYEWNIGLGAFIPKLMVEAENDGIQHSFLVNNDMFSGEPIDTAINYYYMAIAYASNDYLTYNQADPTTYLGQKLPYKPSRRSVGLEKVKVFLTNISNTGIDTETNLPSIKLFPSPFNNNVEIITSSNKRQLLQVIDNSGRIILTKTISKPEETINTSRFKPGVYYFRFMNEKGITSIKALKN